MSERLDQRLQAIAGGFSGTVGYAIANLSAGESLHRAGDQLFPTASAIKLPLLTALHECAGRGAVDLDQVIEPARLPAPGDRVSWSTSARPCGCPTGIPRG